MHLSAQNREVQTDEGSVQTLTPLGVLVIELGLSSGKEGQPLNFEVSRVLSCLDGPVLQALM